MLPPRFRIAALCACLVAAPALAGSHGSDELLRLAPLSLAELLAIPVVTASRQQENRAQTPAHIIVVTREQIRERRYRNLADLLEDLPGVDFMRGTKSSAYNYFSIQGHAGSTKLLILLDGVRIGHPAGGNVPVAENYALYHAKQVEVLYGPAAALYGADAVAAVINIVTERASAGENWVSAGGGAFGAREVSFMAGTGASGQAALRIGGHWQRADRAPLDAYYPAQFPRVDARRFDGTVAVPAGAREAYVGDIGSHSVYARLDLSEHIDLGYYRNEFHSLTSTGDPPRTALYLPDARWQTRIETAYGKARFEPFDGVQAELVVDYSLLRVTPNSRYVNIFTGFEPGYAHVRGERLGVEQNLNWRIDQRHRVQAGVGYQEIYAIEASDLPRPYDTGRGPGEQAMTYRNTNLPMTIHDARYHNLSLYAQLHTQWREAFSTMVGARLDRHSDYGDSFNPRLGAVWQPAPRHLLKLLYGEAFRAPSPEESLNSFGTFDGSVDAGGKLIGRGFRVPNFQIEPENTRTLSLTWDWRPRADVHVMVNGYRSDTDNLILTLPAPAAAADSIPGATLVAPEHKGNAGKAAQKGMDLIGQWRFHIGDDWSGDVWGSYGWVSGWIDEGNGVRWDLPYLAANKFKLGATVRYRDRLTVTPSMYWIGDTTNGRKLDASTPPKRRETPGYQVTNLHIGWHQVFDRNATLWLDVYNLFDERYYVAHGSGSRTFFDMPQQPRSWQLSLEIPF